MIAYQVNTVSGLARYFGFKEKKNVINSFIYGNFNKFSIGVFRTLSNN